VSVGWVITGAVVLALLILLFAPIEAELRLRPSAGLSFRIRWLGIPFGLKGVARRKPAERRERRKRGGAFSLRTGRAVLRVLRTEGVPSLLWRVALWSFDAIELVRAKLVVTVGLGDPAMTGWLSGLMAAVRPRFEAGQGRIHLELTPDFGGGRFISDGDLVLRTRPFPWLVIGTRVLFAKATWRARRAWKEVMNPPAESED
jgi:hypothetical protein